ncbi:MAG: Maf family protein [Lachnospiraceae bacterium]|nr:Maf family protein [Lachnospiraceae bacterium]
MKNKISYILASGSPRRKEILTRIGIPFELMVSEISEDHEERVPDRIVSELSRRKALAVADLCGDMEGAVLVIGADTLVALDGVVLGKPVDRADSERMIRMLSGKAHQVYTGVTMVLLPQKEIRTFWERTDVHVKELSEEEIRSYVDSGEGDDKAGAYAIQGAFGAYISAFAGDYDNVVGFPAQRFLREKEVFLNEFGL